MNKVSHLKPNSASKINRLATLLLLILVSLSCARVIKSSAGGYVMLHPYRPQEIRSSEDLPPEIYEKLMDHLKARLGTKYSSLCKVIGGQIVDQIEMHRVDPDCVNRKWQVFDYNVICGIEDRQLGFSYSSSIWLDKNGEILREIKFPNIALSPEKEKIISYSEARKIAKSNHFDTFQASVELHYREKEDALCWRFEKVLEGNAVRWQVRTLVINAHSGNLEGDSKSEQFY